MQKYIHKTYNTTRIHQGPGDFNKPGLVMIFLTNVEVTWILCSTRLVLEGKAGKGIESQRFEFLEKAHSSQIQHRVHDKCCQIF